MLPEDDARMRQAAALLAEGRDQEALATYEAVLAMDPGHRAARRERALLIGRMGRWREALGEFQRMLADWPEDAGLLVDRGYVLMSLEDFPAALSSYQQATAMEPGSPDAQFNMGVALQMLDRHAAAVAAFDAALAAQPAMTGARINRANSLRRLHRHEDAIADYRAVLEREPNNAMARANLGKTLTEIGHLAAGLAEMDRAITAAPETPETRWLRATATIPAVRQAGEDVAVSRAAFATALAEYDAWAAAAGDLPAVVNVGRPHPFFLAYQDADNRELLARHGSLCARIMARWMTANAIMPAVPRPPGTLPERVGPLHIGIVSAHIQTHSVWLAIVRGWLRHADPAAVRYHVFHLSGVRDQQTELAMRLSAQFEQGPRGLRDWVAAIQAAAPDVLVFPDIGMDDMTMKLAAMRLAPVQVASWGHPETTGLPTIDAYVSAEALEPPGADAHYTEWLVRLPRLGCCYEMLPVAARQPDLAALGLRADAPILLCPGVPFKYTPEHDTTYAAIARAVPGVQLVFFRQDVNPLLSEAAFARLRAAAGDAADRLHLVPWQDLAGFYGLMRRADLFLDTIGFSGFNTAMQAIECGLPVVTMEGRFMRGRLASGIMRRIDMPEMVAADPADYVRLAVNLARDEAARRSVAEKLLRNRARLFNDVGAVRAFEAFLRAAAGHAGA